MHIRGRGLVLQQLDQLVAEHHLARRDRQIAPHLELLGARGRHALEHPVHIVDQVLAAAQQVAALLMLA